VSDFLLRLACTLGHPNWDNRCALLYPAFIGWGGCEGGFSLTFCPGWPWTVIFQIASSQVARITYVSHCKAQPLNLKYSALGQNETKPVHCRSTAGLITLKKKKERNKMHAEWRRSESCCVRHSKCSASSCESTTSPDTSQLWVRGLNTQPRLTACVLLSLFTTNARICTLLTDVFLGPAKRNKT
jgi:hypothetical protein